MAVIERSILTLSRVASLPWKAALPLQAISAGNVMAHAVRASTSTAVSLDANQLSRMWESYPAISASPSEPYGNEGPWPMASDLSDGVASEAEDEDDVGDDDGEGGMFSLFEQGCR